MIDDCDPQARMCACGSQRQGILEDRYLKKIRIAILTVILAALFCVDSAMAESVTKIYGDTIECRSGDTVKYSVSISGNPGMTAFVIGAYCENDWVYFDDEVSQGSFSDKGTFLGENDVRFVNTAWYCVDAVSGDGTLFSFDVHVSPSAPDGDYPIKVMVSKENTIDGDLKEIKYEAVDGLIKVTHVEPDMSQYTNRDDGLRSTTIMLIALAAVCLAGGTVWVYSAKKKKGK